MVPSGNGAHGVQWANTILSGSLRKPGQIPTGSSTTNVRYPPRFRREPNRFAHIWEMSLPTFVVHLWQAGRWGIVSPEKLPGIDPPFHQDPSAVDRLPPTCPRQPTPLVGRHQELEELEARLAAPDCRLLTGGSRPASPKGSPLWQASPSRRPRRWAMPWWMPWAYRPPATTIPPGSNSRNTCNTAKCSWCWTAWNIWRRAASRSWTSSAMPPASGSW